MAAGGGSILTYRNGLFNAGPQSAVRDAFMKLKDISNRLNRERIQALLAIERVDL